MDPIAAIHAEVNYAAYEAQLRGIDGLWNTLESLRARVTKDQRLAKQYRTLLERSIAKFREQEADALSGSAIQDAENAFIAWYEAEKAARGVTEREQLRIPSDLQAWVTKWHPKVAAELDAARVAVNAEPTRRGYARLRAAAQQVMAAFLDGF